MPPLTQTVIIDNHLSALQYPDTIKEYLADEVSAGRMSGPFPRDVTEQILRGPFFSSPLIVSVQTQAPGTPDKLRVCRHLSKSNKTCCSVNSHVNKEDFPTRFDTASRVADIISRAPAGTQACTFDIAKFHRTCPVIPAHKPWLVVQGEPGEFYVDHVHPFGSAAASSNAGMIGNAVVDIWQAEGARPTLKYEDDLKVFRCPLPHFSNSPSNDAIMNIYDYDRAEILQRISSLGVPWHKEKGDAEFLYITTFIGYSWDLIRKLVTLPDEKRLKFHNRVRVFLDSFSSSRCTLKDVERIHGSLCHVAFVYIEGCSRLPSLSNFAASFKGNELLRRYPSRSMMTDLRWWLQILDKPSFSRELRPRGDIKDLGLYVDASTSWGIGIIIEGHWAAFKLHADWKAEGRDICWLETLALEFLIYFLDAMDIRDAHLLIHSDNTGAIGALDKGRSPNYHINLSVRRMYTILVSRFITHHLKYVPSSDNPADPISRGELGPAQLAIPYSFSMPDELVPLFIHER